MTTVNTLPTTCPKCNKRFKATITFSCGYKRITTDLRPLYWGMNPMPNRVIRCPFCSFADFVNGFIYDPPPETVEDYQEYYKRFREELKDLKRSTVTNGASERFDIAARYEKEGQPPEIIAKIFKEGVDAIRMSGQKSTLTPTLKVPTSEIDIKCARKCAHAFESSPKNLAFAYIAAEHYRLAGEFDLAKKWYQIYKDAIKNREDPPVALKLVNRVENEALKGNSKELLIEEEMASIFVRGLNF
ncbi:MAG: DUF2225 domain-containing protein [Candidatus Helarchaeota archaeon]|nr:DUF2225 domain-containing protein [Candidatus Helarchaeota archaeon]